MFDLDLGNKQLWIYTANPSPKDVETGIKSFTNKTGLTPTHIYVKPGQEKLFETIATELIVVSKPFMLYGYFALACEQEAAK